MSGGDTAETAVHEAFAGRRRTFRLRIGEIEELERICGAGIHAIAMRVWTGNCYARDLIETVRLGLEGGGATEAEATAIAQRYGVPPLLRLHELAAKILTAAMSGVEADEGKEGEETSGDPATSPPSSPPGPPSDSLQPTSAG